jgi:hypothetical protein
VSYVTLRWLSKKCTYFAACQRWPKAKIGEEELGVEEPNPEPDGTIRRSFRRTAAGISNKVTLHISREKDGKFRLVCAGWDDTKVVQPDGCGQARRGWKGGAYPLAREAAPPLKN